MFNIENPTSSPLQGNLPLENDTWAVMLEIAVNEGSIAEFLGIVDHMLREYIQEKGIPNIDTLVEKIDPQQEDYSAFESACKGIFLECCLKVESLYGQCEDLLMGEVTKENDKKWRQIGPRLNTLIIELRNDISFEIASQVRQHS